MHKQFFFCPRMNAVAYTSLSFQLPNTHTSTLLVLRSHKNGEGKQTTHTEKSWAHSAEQKALKKRHTKL